jgi:hypothetical protein
MIFSCERSCYDHSWSSGLEVIAYVKPVMVQDYIIKPFSPDDLIGSVSGVLGDPDELSS